MLFIHSTRNNWHVIIWNILFFLCIRLWCYLSCFWYLFNYRRKSTLIRLFSRFIRNTLLLCLWLQNIFSPAYFIEDLFKRGLTYGVLLDVHCLFICLEFSKDLPQLQVLVDSEPKEGFEMLNYPRFSELLLNLLTDSLTNLLMESKLSKNLHWNRFILLKLVVDLRSVLLLPDVRFKLRGLERSQHFIKVL